MPQHMALASQIPVPAGPLTWTTRREACLRPEYAALYPGVHAGIWEPAAVVVDQTVAARLLGGENRAVRGRVLSDDHFDFRGGVQIGARIRREDR